MKNILSIIWQLPQTIVGLVAMVLFGAKPYTVYKDARIYSWRLKGGVSLGRFIFVPFKMETVSSEYVQQYIKHEYGHTVQSKYLGWTYLLVIGLPSLIWAGCLEQYRKKKNKSYYDFYTEKWADRLGCVRR